MSDERWLERLAALVFRFIGLAMVLQGSLVLLMLILRMLGGFTGNLSLFGGILLFVLEIVVGVYVLRSSRRLGEIICRGL